MTLAEKIKLVEFTLDFFVTFLFKRYSGGAYNRAAALQIYGKPVAAKRAVHDGIIQCIQAVLNLFDLYAPKILSNPFI